MSIERDIHHCPPFKLDLPDKAISHRHQYSELGEAHTEMCSAGLLLPRVPSNPLDAPTHSPNNCF